MWKLKRNKKWGDKADKHISRLIVSKTLEGMLKVYDFNLKKFKISSVKCECWLLYVL